MSGRRIALATCAQYPGLHVKEQPLLGCFEALGIEAQPAVWDDPAVEWRRFDRVVVRATWDYFEKAAAFFAWLDRMELLKVAVYNPVPLLRWNADKRYLRDLAGRGVRIVHTELLEAPCDLRALLETNRWSRAVMKPSISGNAHRTWVISPDDAAARQGDLEETLRGCAVLVQPFMPEIVDEGEWSLFFFGGAYSHAILKKPAEGDFRSQPTFGGSFRAVEPPPPMMRAAETVLASLPLAPLYARIDGLRRGDDFLVMEVELIEPYLFFSADPHAMDRYVRAVANV